jgi:hypothetical protein
LVATSSPKVEGTVASPLARFRSTSSARATRAALAGSTVSAKRAFDWVYSCAQ